MMNCISADKLTLYVDGLLETSEQDEVTQHLKACKECQMVVVMFEDENKALKETLSAPGLPDSFADDVLQQLEPLKSKRKAYWIRGLEVAAAAILCIGFASAVSPSFNGFVSSLFEKESEPESQVTEAFSPFISGDLETKLKRGIVYSIDSIFEGDERKLIIEDLVVEVNRVGFTFKVTDFHGEVLEPEIQMQSLYFKKPDGSLLSSNQYGIEWLNDGYGYFEATLNQFGVADQLTLSMEIEHLANKNEQLKVELPINFNEANAQANVSTINEGSLVIEGHEVQFEQLLTTPYQSGFTYTIGKTKEYEDEQKDKLAELTNLYGAIQVGEQAELMFKVVNGAGEQVARWAPFIGTNESERFLDITTFEPGKERMMGYNVQFEPIAEEPLFIHVDGIMYSHVEAGAVTFNTERLTIMKPQLVLENATYTIRNMNMQGEQLKISMDLVAHSKHHQLDYWVLIDGKGDRFSSVGSSSSVNDEGFGYYEIKFNKPSVVGPYTLIAVSGSKLVQLDEPIVIEVK